MRHSNANFDYLLAFLDTLKHKFNIIILTETYVQENNNTFQIESDRSFNLYRNGSGHGITIFVLHSLTSHSNEQFVNMNNVFGLFI